ncbi:energy transducer TonB [Profundibacter sp.]
MPLALAIHLGVWAISPASIGVSSPGGSPVASVTLAAATAHHTALARSWQTPPQLSPVSPLAPALPAAPVLPPQDDMADNHAPSLRQSDQNPRHARPVQPQVDQPDSMAQVDTHPPAAPAKPDPAPRAKPPPKPATPKPSSAPSPAQSASGGQNAKARQSGQSGQDTTQSANAATRNALRARWGAKIQRRVHRRMIYPRGATGTGVVQVALTISKTGRLTGLRLTQSSGVAAFDQAALRAVRRAGQFPKAPRKLLDQSYSFTLSLSFRP